MNLKLKEQIILKDFFNNFKKSVLVNFKENTSVVLSIEYGNELISKAYLYDAIKYSLVSHKFLHGVIGDWLVIRIDLKIIEVNNP